MYLVVPIKPFCCSLSHLNPIRDGRQEIHLRIDGTLLNVILYVYIRQIRNEHIKQANNIFLNQGRFQFPTR